MINRLKRWVAPALSSNARRRVIAVARAGERPSCESDRPSAFGGRNALTEVIQLAWPIAAAMIGETAIGLVDTKLVGGLGATALGGVGIATTLMFLSYSMMFGLARGVKVRTAHAVGRGQPGEGVRYALAGSLIGIVMGTLVFLACRDISWALRILRVDASLFEPARVFLAARTYSAPATCMLAALIQHRQALGDTKTPMVVGITGNVVNALLAYGLIYGKFGLPALGVAGAGYGTAVTEYLEWAVMLLLLARDALRAKAAPLASVPFSRALRGVCELGIPTGLQFGAEMLAFTTFTAILGSLGDGEIAAHQVALAIIRVSFLPGVAVGEAASVLVGQRLGQNDLAGADRSTRASLVVGVGFMALCGVAFAVFGRALAGAFSDDPAVAEIARRLLLIAAVFQVLDAVNIVLRGALRGAKDVRVVALIGISVVWICIPGAAFVLGRVAGFGAAGGWCGFVLESTLSAILFWYRWKGGAWRQSYAQSAARHSDTSALVPATFAG